MFIDTTINVHACTIKRISDVSRKSRLSRRYIVSWLLGKAAGGDMMPAVTWSRIRYQDRDKKTNWDRMHVMLSPAEYELLLDLRKVYKLSGSRIIAYAVEHYIDELLDTSNSKTDNYRFSCYVFSRFIMDGVICWAQYWGMPRNPHAFPDLPLPIRNQVPSRGS